MRSSARKFVSRAPRYELSPGDNSFLRFARNDERGRTFTTRFVDISQSGLAFVTDRENAPQISDLIKVEIPLDNEQTVAWWARVVRVEEYAPHKWYMKKENFDHDDQVRVAITFHELPPAHAAKIRDTLNKKFDEVFQTERKRRMKHMAIFVASEFWKLLLYGVCVAATIWFLWAFSRPDANYDAEKGTPWMQRFPSVNIPDTAAPADKDTEK